MPKKNKEASNAWEYAEWLHRSGRLTTEEHTKLLNFLVDLEDETRLAAESSCNEGC